MENLALSGEPIMPLPAWTVRDQPGIEALDIKGLWYWTRKRDQFRYSYLKGTARLARRLALDC